MNIRSFKVIGIVFLFVAVSIVFLAARSNSDDLRRDLLVKVISFAVNSGHYQPGDLNDKFSEKAFKLYIERVDYAKRFLLQEDIDQLSEYKKELDDALQEVNFEFLDKSIEILNRRTSEAKVYYTDVLSKPFDFSIDEEYEFDADNLDFVKTKQELKERWRKTLKYETMARLYDLDEEQKEAAEKSDTVTIKDFTQLEIDARAKVIKRYDDWFHRMEQFNDDDRLNIYVNSLVNVFDPHTQYFPPRDKENFDIRFSGQLEGIGAQLTQRDSYIEVTKIIPGSPSWKQGELEVGDLITKVAQGNDEYVDVVDMRLDDAVQLIRGKKGTKVRLRVKKLDKSITEIVLVRDVVVLEETYAKSVIIKDEETEKNYGYLKLPSFYVDFSKANGRNCFDDVKKEIEKLNDENIEGLVFDLRNNGGGSLEDVVKIAGLFIEQGPIVQSMGRKGMQRTLEDKDPQIQYDGPVVVMVNTISASASEIFAAAMQDYNRAIIVGTNSTYGKGTVQNFSELDRMVPRKPADMKELGSLKMTVQKFYRVNGGATQLKGVTPDIVFPDYYNYMDFGEKDLEYVMPWDEISALSYDQWDLSFDKNYIEQISKKRIKNDSVLLLIDENGQRLKSLREETTNSLNYEKYTQKAALREEEGAKYDHIGKDTLSLAIEVLKVDLPTIEADTSSKARSDAWIMGLKKDIYLSETINILNDIGEYKIENAGKLD